MPSPVDPSRTPTGHQYRRHLADHSTSTRHLDRAVRVAAGGGVRALVPRDVPPLAPSRQQQRACAGRGPPGGAATRTPGRDDVRDCRPKTPRSAWFAGSSSTSGRDRVSRRATPGERGWGTALTVGPGHGPSWGRRTGGSTCRTSRPAGGVRRAGLAENMQCVVGQLHERARDVDPGARSAAREIPTRARQTLTRPWPRQVAAPRGPGGGLARRSSCLASAWTRQAVESIT